LAAIIWFLQLEHGFHAFEHGFLKLEHRFHASEHGFHIVGIYSLVGGFGIHTGEHGFPVIY
jgi:hypothetical protein